MTTEQIEMTRVIAEYDGWKYHDKSDVYRPNGYWTLAEVWAGKWVIENLEYLTSMDWLHPVAMKVMGMLNHLYKVSRDRKFMDLAEQIKIACATKPVKGEYLWLFTAVYNGIVFLNEQNVKP